MYKSLQATYFATYMKKKGYKKGINVKNFALTFLKLPLQDDTNLHDYGIFTIRHMEIFYAHKVENWNNAFKSNKVHPLSLIHI